MALVSVVPRVQEPPRRKTVKAGVVVEVVCVLGAVVSVVVAVLAARASAGSMNPSMRS